MKEIIWIFYQNVYHRIWYSCFFLEEVLCDILPSWEEGSWGWKETLWCIPQSLQQLQRGWDKTTWLQLCLPSWESNHAASPLVCPALCRDEGQISVIYWTAGSPTAEHFNSLMSHNIEFKTKVLTESMPKFQRKRSYSSFKQPFLLPSSSSSSSSPSS